MALTFSELVESFKHPFKMKLEPSKKPIVDEKKLSPEVVARRLTHAEILLMTSVAHLSREELTAFSDQLQALKRQSDVVATAELVAMLKPFTELLPQLAVLELYSWADRQLFQTLLLKVHLSAFEKQPETVAHLAQLDATWAKLSHYLAHTCQDAELLRYFKTKSFLKLMPAELKQKLVSELAIADPHSSSTNLDEADDLLRVVVTEAEQFVTVLMPKLQHLPAAFSPALQYHGQLSEAAHHGLERITQATSLTPRTA